MGYIGTVGERIKVEVTLTGEYEYTTQYMWQTQYHHIYTMTDEQGNVLVWKTTALMGYEVREKDPRDPSLVNDKWYGIHKGDIIKITATVKDHAEYKGQEQTEVQRLKVNERTFKAKTPAEIAEEKRIEKEARKQEQMDSIKEGDFIWRMPYRQYKEHYSDCETVIDSYNCSNFGRDKSIEVIIREGRLKASGVRGKHYSGYCFQNEDGKKITYCAVSEENALRRVQKEFPEHEWECVKIYNYRV